MDCGVTQFDADLKLYFAFQGTDSFGANCLSASYTPMKFLPYTWGKIYDELNKK
jgi:hypothetical protein